MADAIQAMTGDIHEVSAIANSIAAAVEEQDAATREIVRNVVQTSQAAEEVSSRIAQVAEEATATGQRADAVRGALEDMGGRVRDLRVSVNHAVRTASPDVDRRRDPRIALHDRARLDLAGQSVDAEMVDLSLGGCHLVGPLPDVAAGTTGTLRFEGMTLPFVVLEACARGLRIQFDAARIDAGKLSALIAKRNSTRRAA